MLGARGGALTLLIASTLFGRAPYQCGKSPDRALREETPAEALYGLAQKLKAEGDERAYRTTLEYIIRRYPSSRFAVAAREDLGPGAPDGGGANGVPTDGGAP